MKVLLTGATGRIGRELIAARPDGITIESLLDPLDPQTPDTPWFRTDIADRDKTIMAITCSDPDVIIHCAALTDVDGCERDPDLARRINIDGTANVVDACAECDAMMVYFSTDYVFDGRTGPYEESDQPNPVSVYGRTKWEGEKVVNEWTDRHLILRISVPFGRRRTGTGHNFVSWLAEELSQGREVRIVDDQFTTPAYMDELVETLWHFIQKGVTGTIHYGTADRMSRAEMAYELCDVLGVDRSLVSTLKTADLGFDAERPLESGFVTERLHELLGRPPIRFRNALVTMMENGPIF